VQEDSAPTVESSGIYHPLLGTNVEISVVAVVGSSRATAQDAAEAGERRAVEEMTRLQAVFTVFDPASELCRWRSGVLDEPSAELVEVLTAAQHWWAVSGGAFHPATAGIRARWLRAEAEQRVPSDAELAALADAAHDLPYGVQDGRLRRTGDCSGVDLNAIAKGYIVDRGVAAALGVPGVIEVLINAGGDLRRAGAGTLTVGVEDPQAPGGSPIRVIELAEGALATSGPVHRGFRIGDAWYGHVLDPRTARPVGERPSTTVRASDAMTADALATVAGVMDWEGACGVLDETPGAAVLAVLPGGELRSHGRW